MRLFINQKNWDIILNLLAGLSADSLIEIPVFKQNVIRQIGWLE